MNERALFVLLQATITAGLTAREFVGIDVRQGEQSRIGGAPEGPAVLLSVQPWRRFGYLWRDDKWVPPAGPVPGVMRHTETQEWEAPFQVNALYPQDPADPTRPAASDLVRAVSNILQSDVGRAQLKAGGVGVLRITDIRQLTVKNDRDQFERVPSFDFVLVFNDSEVSQTPHTHEFEGRVVAA